VLAVDYPVLLCLLALTEHDMQACSAECRPELEPGLPESWHADCLQPSLLDDSLPYWWQGTGYCDAEVLAHV